LTIAGGNLNFPSNYKRKLRAYFYIKYCINNQLIEKGGGIWPYEALATSPITEEGATSCPSGKDKEW
jgi:hypothetical protein